LNPGPSALRAVAVATAAVVVLVTVVVVVIVVVVVVAVVCVCVGRNKAQFIDSELNNFMVQYLNSEHSRL